MFIQTPRLPDCELPEYATGSSGKTVSHLEAKTFGNLPARSDRSFLQWSLRSRGLYGQTAKWETTSKTNIADIWLVCCGLEVNSY